jgi:signal transduction histidine kinase
MDERGSSLTHLQAAVTIGVVASFLTATIVVAHHAAAVGRDADVMVGHALPSIHDLSMVREALHRLDFAARDWVDLSRRGGAPAVDSLDAYTSEIEGPLSSYALRSTGEHRGDEDFGVRNRLTAAETSARRMVDALRSGDDARALLALSDEHRAAVGADAALQSLVDLSMARAVGLGHEIATVRRSTRRIALVLNGLAVGLAALASALTVVIMRRRVTALQQAKALAERKSTELDGFAGRVAHDILSPLGAVYMALGVLAPCVRGDDLAENALRRASRSLTRVKTLVDGLLRFARAAAQPEPGATADVSAVVRDVLDGMRREAQDRGIRLDSEEAECARVASSVGVLTSLVSNLVQNAIKYMGDRPRRVVIVRTRATEDRVRVEVEDTGPGVPADIAESIFEPFVRGVSGEAGVGLGLATTRQLVRAHGGTVCLSTRPGDGSLFWFELPRAREWGPDPRPSKPSAAASESWVGRMWFHPKGRRQGRIRPNGPD